MLSFTIQTRGTPWAVGGGARLHSTGARPARDWVHSACAGVKVVSNSGFMVPYYMLPPKAVERVFRVALGPEQCPELIT